MCAGYRRAADRTREIRPLDAAGCCFVCGVAVGRGGGRQGQHALAGGCKIIRVQFTADGTATTSGCRQSRTVCRLSAGHGVLFYQVTHQGFRLLCWVHGVGRSTEAHHIARTSAAVNTLAAHLAGCLDRCLCDVRSAAQCQWISSYFLVQHIMDGCDNSRCYVCTRSCGWSKPPVI